MLSYLKFGADIIGAIEEQKRVYSRLTGADKAIVDGAFKVLDQEGETRAMLEFVRLRAEYGVGTEMDMPILMEYRGSKVDMRRGILEFYFQV